MLGWLKSALERLPAGPIRKTMIEAGSFTVDDWIEYTQEFFNKLKIQENQSIFDVGCGSGAFVFPLYLKNNKGGG